LIKEAIGKGATTEAAIEAAKAELNAPADADVKFEVLKTAKKKTLGLFGGSLAEVKAYYEIPDAKPVATKKAVKPTVEKKVEKPVAEKKVKAEKKIEPVKVEEKKPVENTAKTVGTASVQAKEYITSILKGMGVEEVDIEANEDDESVYVQINCGNDYGFIIGRRGETLDSIQYLTRLVINKGNDGYKRVSINAGNYREKREDTLRELAKKNAARVKKYGRSVCLDPMNPYERRIIHTAIQEIEGVDSHSVGSESDRKVVITLAEGFKATNPSNGKNRHDNRSRGSKSNQEAPARAPRSDSAVVGLYGKIETK